MKPWPASGPGGCGSCESPSRVFPDQAMSPGPFLAGESQILGGVMLGDVPAVLGVPPQPFDRGTPGAGLFRVEDIGLVRNHRQVWIDQRDVAWTELRFHGGARDKDPVGILDVSEGSGPRNMLGGLRVDDE